MKQPYKLTWNSNKTVRIVTLHSDLMASLKNADELVTRFMVQLILGWLNKAAGKHVLNAGQQRELNAAGIMYYAMYPRLSCEAYQAVQWMFLSVDRIDTPDIEALLPVLDKVVKHMRSLT